MCWSFDSLSSTRVAYLGSSLMSVTLVRNKVKTARQKLPTTATLTAAKVFGTRAVGKTFYDIISVYHAPLMNKK